VENVRMIADNEERNQASRRKNFQGIFKNTRRTHITVLHANIKVYELLKSANKIHIATDGGAIPLKGSLGFVFADGDGKILLTCFRQPSGNDPLSFRSEICAFLAAYDKKLTRDKPMRSKIQAYTDSLSMINKLTGFLLWRQFWRHFWGSFFTGAYLPQKFDILPRLESERNSVQKHVPSY
jgi:hypothetical protein